MGVVPNMITMPRNILIKDVVNPPTSRHHIYPNVPGFHSHSHRHDTSWWWYHVINPDYVGQGDSSPSPRIEDYQFHPIGQDVSVSNLEYQVQEPMARIGTCYTWLLENPSCPQFLFTKITLPVEGADGLLCQVPSVPSNSLIIGVDN